MIQRLTKKKQLLVQLLKVRHTEVCDTELLESVDFNSLFESIEAEGEHYDNYREEAIRIGSNLVELYRTDDGQAVELDEGAQKHLEIFVALKAVALPIVRKSSDNIEELATDMSGNPENQISSHADQVRTFLETLASDKFQFKFGNHSEYIH